MSVEITDNEEVDLSGVQDVLDLFTPKVRERVINLSNDIEVKCPYNVVGDITIFAHIFYWAKSSEGYFYWRDIDDAIHTPSLRAGNKAFIKVA